MNNFNIHPTYQNNEGIEYNPYSRMNYGVNFLAKDKTKPTLVQKATTGAEIEGVGTAYLLAHSDQQKIRRMYGCKELETRQKTAYTYVITVSRISIFLGALEGRWTG